MGLTYHTIIWIVFFSLFGPVYIIGCILSTIKAVRERRKISKKNARSRIKKSLGYVRQPNIVVVEDYDRQHWHYKYEWTTGNASRKTSPGDSESYIDRSAPISPGEEPLPQPEKSNDGGKSKKIKVTVERNEHNDNASNGNCERFNHESVEEDKISQQNRMREPEHQRKHGVTNLASSVQDLKDPPASFEMETLAENEYRDPVVAITNPITSSNYGSSRQVHTNVDNLSDSEAVADLPVSSNISPEKRFESRSKQLRDPRGSTDYLESRSHRERYYREGRRKSHGSRKADVDLEERDSKYFELESYSHSPITVHKSRRSSKMSAEHDHVEKDHGSASSPMRSRTHRRTSRDGRVTYTSSPYEHETTDYRSGSSGKRRYSSGALSQDRFQSQDDTCPTRSKSLTNLAGNHGVEFAMGDHHSSLQHQSYLDGKGSVNKAFVRSREDSLT